MPFVIGYLVIATVCIAVLGFPLANVAETFEHDVVRAPNNPGVVQRAETHFGQQQLAHPRGCSSLQNLLSKRSPL